MHDCPCYHFAVKHILQSVTPTWYNSSLAMYIQGIIFPEGRWQIGVSIQAGGGIMGSLLLLPRLGRLLDGRMGRTGRGPVLDPKVTELNFLRRRVLVLIFELPLPPLASALHLATRLTPVHIPNGTLFKVLLLTKAHRYLVKGCAQ